MIRIRIRIRIRMRIRIRIRSYKGLILVPGICDDDDDDDGLAGSWCGKALAVPKAAASWKPKDEMQLSPWLVWFSAELGLDHTRTSQTYSYVPMNAHVYE